MKEPYLLRRGRRPRRPAVRTIETPSRGMSGGHPLRVLSFMVVRARVSIARSEATWQSVFLKTDDLSIFPKKYNFSKKYCRDLLRVSRNDVVFVPVWDCLFAKKQV